MWVKVNNQHNLQKFTCCSIAKTDLINCLSLKYLLWPQVVQRIWAFSKHQFGGWYSATKSTIKLMSLNTSVNIFDTFNSKDTILLNQSLGVCFTWDIHFSSGVTVPLKYSLLSLLLTPLVIFQRSTHSTVALLKSYTIYWGSISLMTNCILQLKWLINEDKMYYCMSSQ